MYLVLLEKGRNKLVDEIEEHERGGDDREGAEETFLECLQVVRNDRQMVILERSNWWAWLGQAGHEAELLRALSPGSLKVEQVR